jgi:hypothetical protein
VNRFLHVAARLSFGCLLVSIAVGLAAGLGTRFHLWDYHLGVLEIFPFCLYVGMGAFVFGLAWIVTAFFAGSGAGAGYALAGFLGSIALLWVPLDELYLTKIAHAIPPIHDISTDTEHAPEFVALHNRRPGATNPADYEGAERIRFEGRTYSAETLQKLYYGEIKPTEALGTTPAKLFHRALTAAQNMGWNIVAVASDSTGGRIEATDSTLLFGLTDDIVIRVKPAGIGFRVDIRSKSRVGTSDFGRNAARILAYQKKLAAT